MIKIEKMKENERKYMKENKENGRKWNKTALECVLKAFERLNI